MRTPPDQSDRELLTGSPWSATPHDYSSMRYLRFGADGGGEAIYGYGQTIYAKVLFSFDLAEGQILRLTYLPSPKFAAFRGYEPEPGAATKSLQYTLAAGTYQGVESVVAWPFVCAWLLTLSESPWPSVLSFPHPVPTAFYGYRHNPPRPSAAP